MNKLITILGPTASGKTKLAVALADKIGGEIISADSRQVYRGMDIGTGKDLADYEINGIKIPFHLIDIIDVGEKYNIFQFQADFQKAFYHISEKNKPAILCGGSGQYILAVLEDYQFTSVPIDENLRQKLITYPYEQLESEFNKYQTDFTEIAKIESRKRLIRAIEISKYLSENKDFKLVSNKPESIVFGLNPEVELRRKRITERLKFRLENGLIEEVETLMAKGIPAETFTYYGLEYKFIVDYLLDRYDYDTFVELLEIAIHQFAKRQMTFFRKMEKDGIKINWIDATLPLELQLKEIFTILN